MWSCAAREANLCASISSLTCDVSAQGGVAESLLEWALVTVLLGWDQLPCRGWPYRSAFLRRDRAHIRNRRVSLTERSEVGSESRRKPAVFVARA
jgi:hypothetical protein